MEYSTDNALVAQARTGDKRAFGQLAERYQEMVRRIAVGMVSNTEIARELAKEAILQAYLSLEQLRDDARFKSWLYGITLNICRNYLREQKADVLSLEAISGGAWHHVPDLLNSVEIVDPQAIAEERELHSIVLQAIQRLSPRDRAATLMFYYDQLTLEEIATLLHISIGAVKGRLYRARRQLQ
jgi:RNA polymerase sigma factor (sigma-70 family)